MGHFEVFKERGIHKWIKTHCPGLFLANRGIVILSITHLPISTLATLKFNPDVSARVPLFNCGFRSYHTVLTTSMDFISLKVKLKSLQGFVPSAPFWLQTHFLTPFFLSPLRLPLSISLSAVFNHARQAPTSGHSCLPFLWMPFPWMFAWLHPSTPSNVSHWGWLLSCYFKL